AGAGGGRDSGRPRCPAGHHVRRLGTDWRAAARDAGRPRPERRHRRNPGAPRRSGAAHRPGRRPGAHPGPAGVPLGRSARVTRPHQKMIPDRTIPPGELSTRVYYEATDTGGVVYYANYLKFFERGRTEWLRALGMDQHPLATQEQMMFVVKHADIAYRQPARLDDRI